MSDTVQGTTLKDAVVKHFVDEIFSGRLKAGDKLPCERELAETLNVSRSIVHLALEQLAAMKLVQMRPRVGNFVSDFMNEGNFSTMLAIAKYADDSIQQDMVYALVELRNTIEGAALRYLASHGTQEDFDSLREMNAEFERLISETDDLQEIGAAYKALHYEIIRRGGNCYYTMIMNSYNNILLPWVKCTAFWTPRGIAEQNGRIIAMLEQGEGSEAADHIAELFERYKAANK